MAATKTMTRVVRPTSSAIRLDYGEVLHVGSDRRGFLATWVQPADPELLVSKLHFPRLYAFLRASDLIGRHPQARERDVLVRVIWLIGLGAGQPCIEGVLVRPDRLSHRP